MILIIQTADIVGLTNLVKYLANENDHNTLYVNCALSYVSHLELPNTIMQYIAEIETVVLSNNIELYNTCSGDMFLKLTMCPT